MTSALALLGAPVAALVVVFNLRRVIFTLASVRGEDAGDTLDPSEDDLPSVLVLVSCRNEEEMIPGMVAALRGMSYPPDKLQVVLIDDGSTDGTAAAMRRHVEGADGWHVLALESNVGKAVALNAALARHGFGECVYVLDADHRPAPDAVRALVRRLFAPEVAAVSGLTEVSDPLASAASYYATVESSVNQLVTMRAKDRLRLAPALLGSNCAYRRVALAEVGGFRPGAFSEDSDLTVAFHLAGYRTRFVEEAVAAKQVPRTTAGYLRQHVRWGWGLNDVAKTYLGTILRSRRLRPALRLELLLFVAGYLDRLAVVGLGLVTIVSLLVGTPAWPFAAVLAIAVGVPLAQIAVLFGRERMGTAMWVRLPLVPLFFLLDAAAAGRSMLDTVAGAPRAWAETRRVREAAR